MTEGLLYPVDIGGWRSYSSLFLEDEQKELQLSNLIHIDELEVCEGILSFIYTKQIAKLSDYLKETFSQIPVVDTITALENEIYHTTTIEGAKTTRVRTSEIHNGARIDPGNFESEKMVENAFKATKLLNQYGKRMDKEVITTVWETMIDQCCHNEELRGAAGEYRKNGEIWVGNHRGIDGVNSYMEKWIRFYNADTLNEKPFIKAAILHYAFENIHPFCDGNGRIGRLLMNNYLIGQNIAACKAVSFSAEIDKSRIHYDAAFVDAENQEADCTPFIEYMLDVMANAAHTALTAGSGGL